MGNQLLLNSESNRQLDRFYQRFSVIQRDPNRNLMFVEEKRTSREFMLRELTTNEDFQKRRIEALVREKRSTRSKFLIRLEDHFFDRDKTYCSSQFRAFLLFESYYKDLREEMLERRISKSPFEEEELFSVIESGVMGLRYLREIKHPHECISSSSILISKDGLMMLSDPWLNPDVLQTSNHVYSSPEQLETAASMQMQKLDWFASDLFSLGVVVLEAYHLEFMDDLYPKNAKTLNHVLMANRITAIRQPGLRRYVEQLLAAPAVRLAIADEIAHQINKPALMRSTSVPSLPPQQVFENNLPKQEIIQRQVKRTVSPDVMRNVVATTLPVAHSQSYHGHHQHHPHFHNQSLPQQPHSYVLKGPNQQPINVPNVNKPKHAPPLPEQHTLHSKFPHQIVPSVQTTANASLHAQGTLRVNPIALSKVNATLTKPFFPADKIVNERPIHLMTSRHQVKHVLTQPEQPPKTSPLAPTDVSLSMNSNKIGLHSMPFVKKNHTFTEISSSITEKQPTITSPTVSTFMNIRNRVNRSVTLSSLIPSVTKNGVSSNTTSASSEMPTPIVGNSQVQQSLPSVVQSPPSTAPQLSSENPSFIKKVPLPIPPIQTSSLRFTAAPSSNEYRTATSPTSRQYHHQLSPLANSHIGTSGLTSASRLQQLLSSPAMNPSDLELFTKPELLEGICTSTQTYSPAKEEFKSFSKPANEPKYPSYTSASANDFISKYIDSDFRYNKIYDSQIPKEPIVPQLVMPQYQYYGAQSDRTAAGNGYGRYQYNEPTYDQYEYREVKTQRVMVANYSPQKLTMAVPLKEESATFAIEDRKTMEIVESQVVIPERPRETPLPSQFATEMVQVKLVSQPVPDAELQKEHNESPSKCQAPPVIVTETVTQTEFIPQTQSKEPRNGQVSLHFTQSEPDREKPDSSNKHHSVDLGQLNTDNEQKYLLSYDMEDHSKIKSDSGHNTSNSSLINAMNMTEPQPPAILLQLTQQNILPKPMTPQPVSTATVEAAEENGQIATPTRTRSQAMQKYNSTIAEVSESENSADAEDDGSEYIIEHYDIGSRYEGYKKNGMRNGKGKFYYQDGGFYEGEWKDNKMHGEGKLYYSESKLAYEGEWYLDEFHGHGKVYNDNPVTLDGTFDYTDFDTLDQYWVYYEGNLVTDTKEGFGRLKLSNGQVFEGEFRKDRIQGAGKFYKANGDIISGLWRDSKLVKVFS